MRVLEHLEPQDVFSYFEDICSIPHGSGNIEQISAYLVDFARTHGLSYRQEPCGNVIIFKGATPGYEQSPTVMLQGHMDMVAVKNPGCDLDMEREGLRLAISDDGKWVYARETSLGGDDGIALAYALSILADDSLPHPALEAVFTVNEEIGLLGAAALDASDLRSTILLNMDSENDGRILTSCAGGATMECLTPAPMETKSGVVFEWKLSGLLGGHSGENAHMELANANVLFGRYLAQVGEKVRFSLGEFEGGEKDNAIANSCRAILAADSAAAETLKTETAVFAEIIKKEYALTDPELKLTLSKLPETEARVLTEDARCALATMLEHLPSGVIRHMPGCPEMVQTSLNLGVLRLKNGESSLTYSVRSASGTEKEWLLKRMADVAKLAGGHSNLSGAYPAWEYLPNSRIQKIMTEVYEEMTGETPRLVGIHAGVECGILSEKLPGIDCVSYGPEIRDIHTTREHMDIASVKKNYELTCRVLERLK